MLIVCPNCSTSYAVEPASLGAAGRTVRCARCKTTWFANGEQAVPRWPLRRPRAKPWRLSGGDSPRPPGEHGGGSCRVLRLPRPITPPERPNRAKRRPSPEMPVAIDAPSLVPSIGSPAHPDTASEPDEIESFAARRKRLQARRKQARRSSRWTALILVLFAFNVALVGARSEVVRFFPQTASLFAAVGLPVNLRNLKFENVRISKRFRKACLPSS